MGTPPEGSVSLHANITANERSNVVSPVYKDCHIRGRLISNITVNSINNFYTPGAPIDKNKNLIENKERKRSWELSLDDGNAAGHDNSKKKCVSLDSGFFELSGTDLDISNQEENSAEVFSQESDKEVFTAPQHLKRKTESSNPSECSRVRRAQQKLKQTLMSNYEGIHEGIPEPGRVTFLKKVYTELHITEGENEELNNEHEIVQIDTASRTQTSTENAIKCNDIFKPLPGREKPIRTVLTKGVAGIGKSVSVQKFILDWAQGEANQDIPFVFPLPFRKLNLDKDERYSFLGYLHDFYPETKELEVDDISNSVFILDGLDESQFRLNFQKRLSDCQKETSLDIMLANLINGSLLPTARIWVTSRPAAANQIPPEYIQRVTEVQGFKDPQKEEYFKKKINDNNLADRIISHIKSSKSLYIMCYIPVICWISAFVLEEVLGKTNTSKIPKTLTEMYTHFLLTLIKIKKKKYPGENESDYSLESEKEIVLKLGQLAYEHLEKSNLIFYEDDLKRCQIDVSQLEHSGVCTEILKRESIFNRKKVYCFVHLTFQEYLAALYVMSLLEKNVTNALKRASTSKKKPKDLTDQVSLDELLKKAVDKALNSSNGHLDLFLRFLFGLSRESSQLLKDILPLPSSNREIIKKLSQYIKNSKRKDMSPDRCINLVYCLVELGDGVPRLEILKDARSGSDKLLTPYECSQLAYLLQMSEKSLDEFDLREYKAAESGLQRLVPVIKNYKKARLSFCNLSPASCKTVSSAISSVGSQLTELDLSSNNLGDNGVQWICPGLMRPQCSLLTLILSNVNLGNPGVQQLCDALSSGHCKLQTLDLSNNDLGDSGVELLCPALRNQDCKLETLRLSGCRVTEKGCDSLALALSSDACHLRELDLSYNHPGESGEKPLSALLQNKLNVEHCGEQRNKPGLQKYACSLTFDPNTANKQLSLSEGNTTITKERREQQYPQHPDRFDSCNQVLCREGLFGTRCYWEVKWIGSEAHIGVTYKDISRKNPGKCCLGQNDKSWSLRIGEKYSAWHENKSTDIPVASPCSGKVGVYLDWPAGSLSFYDVSNETRKHLYTFQTTFTGLLFPGFRVSTGRVTLC